MNQITESVNIPVKVRLAQASSPEAMEETYGRARKFTVSLADGLSEEDCCAQSMPDASPVKWHMAHTTWFFETFILEKWEENFQPFHPAFRMLFNSYYNGVGEKHVRAQRGLLTRPSFDEVLAYRHQVDERIGRLLADREKAQSLCPLIELGLQHEQQHQELILTDVKHLLFMNPLKPAYANAEGTERPGQFPPDVASTWQNFGGGVVEIGHSGDGFCFDNETPRHRQYIEPYSMASRLVTNKEYLEFVQDGGYRNSDLWLSEGWEWVKTNGLSHPFYWHWQQEQKAWQEFTLYGMQTLNPELPVTHLSYFEADAFARWTGARLPTEAEWEHAASACRDMGKHGLHPGRAANIPGMDQFYGACWQWTSSSYGPYPGYRPAAGAIGEYNGKFMVNQYVLRGSSCTTPDTHTRLTYRNFFPATTRWQFTGIRLARS
jgi:ergothioneine biosynthesis protein EgtB